MNKLVSKNPVQRFKEGRKIVKAEEGTQFWMGRMGDWYSGTISPRKGGGNVYSNPTQIVPEKIVPQKDGRTIAKINGQWYNQKGQKVVNFKSSTPKTNNLLKKHLVDNVFINGYQTNDDITQAGGVRAMQQKLKDAGYDLGKFGVDGKWGQNTEEAYQKYLIANAAKTPSLEDTISAAQNQPILSTPTINPSEYTFTESQLSGLGENPYYEPHPELRFNNFDRTQTRQWLRDNGFNPYSLTGAQRKALRMILNGQGTDEDKNLIGLTNGLSEILTNYKYLKQGGTMNILPPINIVERFKNGGVQKFQKAGNLPTAPKAKDRYKDSKRYDLWIGPEGMYNEKSVRTNDLTPGWITQTIRYTPMHKSMDTTYTETPPSILPVNKQKRIAIRNGEWKGNSFVSNPKEYEVLKRRFNNAWNLAK